MHLNLDVFYLIHLFVSYTFNIFCILRHYSSVSTFKAVWSFVFVFFFVFMSILAKAMLVNISNSKQVLPNFFPCLL